MTPAQREAVEAFEKYGSKQKAADVLGISRSALRDRLAHAKKYLEADDSIKSAMNEVGMRDIDLLHSGWIKTEGASLYFQMPGLTRLTLWQKCAPPLTASRQRQSCLCRSRRLPIFAPCIR